MMLLKERDCWHEYGTRYFDKTLFENAARRVRDYGEQLSPSGLRDLRALDSYDKARSYGYDDELYPEYHKDDAHFETCADRVARHALLYAHARLALQTAGFNLCPRKGEEASMLAWAHESLAQAHKRLVASLAAWDEEDRRVERDVEAAVSAWCSDSGGAR